MDSIRHMLLVAIVLFMVACNAQTQESCDCLSYHTDLAYPYNYTNSAGTGCLSGDCIYSTFCSNNVCRCYKDVEMCEPFDETAGFIALAVVLLIIIGICGCICCCICLCIKCCCKGAMQGCYNLICCPFRLSKYALGKIFFCRGCGMRVGVQLCSTIFNGAATFFMILRMGVIASLSPDDFVKGDMQKALLIILFILISFGIKSFRSWQANKKAKNNAESENIQAEKVKDLQTTVITLSDTVFKIIAAIAIFIGSSYSGTDDSCADEVTVCQSVVFEYIKYASILGFSNEIIEMFDQYLTMAIFFKEMKEDTEEDIGFQFDMYKKQDEKKKEPKVESTQDIQKTILWQAAGASVKMFILLAEQLLVLIAAIKLVIVATDDELYFMIAVIVCCVIIISIAFFMCCKFQRLSFGLCCKYYCCCFYKCCADHCETKWIKLDPIENEDAILNHLGQVILVVNAPVPDIGPVIAPDADGININTNTINPSLTVQQQQQQQQQPQIVINPQQPQQAVYQNVQMVPVQMHQMIQQSQVIQQQPSAQQQVVYVQQPSAQQPQVIQQSQVTQQSQPQIQSQVTQQLQSQVTQQAQQAVYQNVPAQMHQMIQQSQPQRQSQVTQQRQSQVIQQAQPQSQPDKGNLSSLVDIVKDGIDKIV